MTTDGDSESEIKASLSKAGQAFASFKNIWKSEISLKTKLHFVKSDVLTGHTAVCVRVMEVHEGHRRQTRCLRQILNIFWRNIISNSELHRTTSTKQHQFCGEKKDGGAGSAMSLGWNHLPSPESPCVGLHLGKRARGRPRETWQKADTGVRNQLGRAEDQSKRHGTVAGSGRGLMCPRARRELSELSECIKRPVKISFEDSF